MLKHSKLKFLILMILMLGILDQSTQTINYCSVDLCDGAKHIACDNTGTFASTCSADAKIIAMTTSLRQAITVKHNQLRNRVALGQLDGFQPAVRMATMIWNSELAKMAEFNVKTCKMQHDACRSTLAFPNAGQNLAYSSWRGMTRDVPSVAMRQIQSWFDEYQYANMQDLEKLEDCENFKNIGHYTAMVQEKNNCVGCSILRQTVNNNTNQLMACNYAYTNVLERAVYRTGTSASKCVSGKNGNFSGLCSVNEPYNVSSMSY